MASGLLYDLSMRLSADVADFRKNIGATSQDMKNFQKSSANTQKSVKGMVDGVSQSLGGLKGVASDMVNSMGGQFGQMTGMFSGMMGMAKAIIPAMQGVRAAIVSTGIGAILIAITLAVAGLISWFKRTDEGSDAMRKAFDQIKAVINVVGDKLSKLGSSIIKLFKGDFKGSVEDLKSAFSGWGDAIKDNIKEANKLNDIQDELENFNEVAALNRAKIEERISELQAKARDEEKYNATERLGFTKQLAKANKDLFDLNYKGKQLELAQLKAEMEISADNQDNRQKVNEKEAELVGINTQYNQSLRETIKLTNKLTDDAKAEADQVKLAAEYRAMKIPDKITNIKSNVQITGLKQIDTTHLLPSELKAPKLDKTSVDDYAKSVDTATYLVDRLAEEMTAVEVASLSMGQTIFGAMKLAATTMTQALGQGAESFKDYGTVVKGTIKDVIGALIAEGVATAITTGLKSAKFAGPLGVFLIPVLAALGAGLAKTAFNSLIPSFATGGIVSTPTMAMVGDAGPGNPEYILPERKLRRLMSESLGGEVRFVIEQNQLVGLLQKYNQKQLYF